MKVLIIGCNGLLGQNLIHTAPDLHDLVGVGNEPQTNCPERLSLYRKVDITQASVLQNAVEILKPDLLINAAALTDVDGCERNPELCDAVNRDAVGVMSQLGLPLVQVSTDYVFDGEAGPYSEEAKTCPLSHYGRSKLESEALVFKGHADNMVVRTLLLWGRGLGAKTPFPDFIRQQLSGGKRVRIVTDQWGNPTLALDLAQAIWRLVSLHKKGLYHVAGSDWMSRLDWALATADFFSLDRSLIDTCLTADLKQAAQRPLKSGLRCDKLQRDTGFVPRGVAEQLKYMAASE